MHISRVRILNFRNFKELLIDHYPHSAVIVGANGVGKSNLLEALRLPLDPSLPDTARVLRPEDICDDAGAALKDGVEVRVEADITGLGPDPAAQAIFGDCVVNPDPMTIRISYVFRRRRGAGTPGELTADDYEWKVFGGKYENVQANQARRHVPLSVLPALRDGVRDLSRFRGSPLQELLKATPPSSSALQAAARTIQGAMGTLAGDGPIKAVASDVDSRLKQLAGPQMEITPTLGFASSKPELLLRSLQLYTDADQARSVADASSGHANVIYLGLLLERFALRRKKDTVVDSLLAVEEPEAHLHPVLQRQLFRSLLRGETSLTVTTHSPNIPAVAPLASLVHLRAVPGGGTVAHTSAAARLTDAQRSDIERYLTVSRAELLFCRAAILVEGPSEAYLLPALARVLGFDLDAYGVIIADVSGVTFEPYRSLLGPSALNVPHVIVTDGDPFRRERGDIRMVHSGLRRARRLMPDDEPLRNLVDTITGSKIPVDPFSARLRAAAEGDVFVGTDTLEADIVPLLGQQMITAFAELRRPAGVIKDFTDAVRSLHDGTGSREDRDELLRKIDAIGKGRFAQRLAGHVETLGSERLARAAAGEAHEEATTESLMRAGDFGYLFAALDRVSRMVRGQGLLPPTVPGGELEGQEESDD